MCRDLARSRDLTSPRLLSSVQTPREQDFTIFDHQIRNFNRRERILIRGRFRVETQVYLVAGSKVFPNTLLIEEIKARWVQRKNLPASLWACRKSFLRAVVLDR